MSKLITYKKLAMCSLTTAALVAASQGAFAHTRLETPTVPEKTKVHNRVNISHGCPPSTARHPTYGTTVVFPNAVNFTPVIGVDSTSGGLGTAKVYTAAPASDFYSPPAGIGTFIRIGGPWDAAQIKTDGVNHDGFWAGGKSYDQTVSTPIQVDFNSAPVIINPASCARSVTFALAIADVCDISVTSAAATDEDVLYWSPIPNFAGVPGGPFGAPTANLASTNLPGGIPAGPKYSNYDGYADPAHTIAGDGWGSPATLKVVRNILGTPATSTTAAVPPNPVPTGCAGNGGLGDDVYVFPSAAQINAELPVWSGINQDGTNYWQ